MLWAVKSSAYRPQGGQMPAVPPRVECVVGKDWVGPGESSSQCPLSVPGLCSRAQTHLQGLCAWARPCGKWTENGLHAVGEAGMCRLARPLFCTCGWRCRYLLCGRTSSSTSLSKGQTHLDPKAKLQHVVPSLLVFTFGFSPSAILFKMHFPISFFIVKTHLPVSFLKVAM